MSRIGKLPIKINEGTTVTLSENKVTVKGTLGELSLEYQPKIEIKIDNGFIYLLIKGDNKEVNALHGLYRSLIDNMVQGVSRGFQKELELRGIGYRVSDQQGNLILNIGYSHPITIEKVDGIKFTVTDNVNIKIEGIDKQLVGQVSAKIRKLRPPEPYKGKGIRYKDEVVIKKSGKSSSGV